VAVQTTGVAARRIPRLSGGASEPALGEDMCARAAHDALELVRNAGTLYDDVPANRAVAMWQAQDPRSNVHHHSM
jgi:hypothetical protein